MPHRTRWRRLRAAVIASPALSAAPPAPPVLDDVLMRRLFEPFVCGPSARSQGLKGLGLGLYLSRAIARAHGGRIEVGSDKHSGTTFRTTLPLE